MKNSLIYYYNINPSVIHQSNDNYKFSANGVEYLFQNYKNNVDILPYLYELNYNLLNNGLPCHQIVLNNNKQIITSINNKNYILLKTYVQNDKITINDMLKINSCFINRDKFKSISIQDWAVLWTNKIDYFEYQISQVGKKFSIIRESFNYYIGMAENAISIYISLKRNEVFSVCHRRIKDKNSLFDLYNPLNFVIDNRVRDLAEYYKHQFYFGSFDFVEFTNSIDLYNLNEYEANLFFVRMLFPSYYFDYYEEILEGKRDENSLSIFISKTKEYRMLLRNLYLHLRLRYSIPEIEWIIKTPIIN